MKICRGILERTQVFDVDGSVRLCSWGATTIGKLTENTMEEIWNGEKAREIFKKLAAGDYSICYKYVCPYLASEDKEVPLIEIDDVPKMPTTLWLGYEHVCNYRCVVCWHPTEPTFNVHNEKIESMRKNIEKNLESVLPHVKFISANGCGELFASKSILKILANWNPVAPKEECSVGLETNASLFDEQHWKQIENLGQYNLSVAITVMSFDEHTYQVLSGNRLPISKLENNLRFVKSLREKGIINHLELATVIQERNFRMLPEFTRRCIEEFGADSVRLLPYIPHNQASAEWRWVSDIKNTNHPYNDEYVKIFEDPIFKNPKVDNWGVVDKDYKWDLPYKVALNNLEMIRQAENVILRNLMKDENILCELKKYLKAQNKLIIVNGAGAVGLFIAKELLKDNLPVFCITDLNCKGDFFGVPIIHPCELPTPSGEVITLLADLQHNQESLQYFYSRGYNDNFVSLQFMSQND